MIKVAIKCKYAFVLKVHFLPIRLTQILTRASEYLWEIRGTWSTNETCQTHYDRHGYPFNAFRSLLGIASGVESPTYAELYSGDCVHPTFSGCLR